MEQARKESFRVYRVANSGNDEFYTPAHAIKPILPYIAVNSVVWCPFDTDDSIFVRMLREAGHTVVATHLSTGGDFYLPPPNVEEWRSDAIYRLFTACRQVASGRRLRLVSYADPISSEPFYVNPSDNPRMQTISEQIERIDGKVLIWCKYTHEIKDIASVLAEAYGDSSVASLFGEMSLRARNESLASFENEARFLVGNTSCGGYGLNLQFCHNVIYYNNDFNWAARAQSEDRVHRIGQKNTVVITNICADKTIDEKILDNLGKKTRMVESFMREIESVKDKRTYLKDILKGVILRERKDDRKSISQQ